MRHEFKEIRRARKQINVSLNIPQGAPDLGEINPNVVPLANRAMRPYEQSLMERIELYCELKQQPMLIGCTNRRDMRALRTFITSGVVQWQAVHGGWLVLPINSKLNF